MTKINPDMYGEYLSEEGEKKGIEYRDYLTVSLMQHEGGDHSIIAAAKVSTRGVESIDDFEAEDPGSSEGLIRFLMRNRHGTPFEHGFMTFFVHAPIFVFREWHRHRIGVSINEESGRYKELDPVFYVPGDSRGGEMQVPGAKPGQYMYEDATPEQRSLIRQDLAEVYEYAYLRYKSLVDSGVAKEVARMCLPVGIYSSMWWSCNPRSLMAFLSLRTKREKWSAYQEDHMGELAPQPGRAKFPSKPQKEIEMGAVIMEEYMKSIYPITYKAFNDFGRVSP